MSGNRHLYGWLTACFVGAVLMGWGGVALAATYHIATSGCSDGFSGSEAQPKCTFANIQGSLTPGDTVYFRGGSYPGIRTDSLFMASGTASNPIVIAGYPGETVTLTPHPSGGVITLWTAGGATSSLQYLVFDNLIIDGQGSVEEAFSAYGPNHHHVILQNSTVRNARNSGIRGGSGASDFTFRNLRVHGHGSSSGDHGFYLGMPRLILEGNEVFDNTGYGIQIQDFGCAGFPQGGCPTPTDDGHVRNNYVHGNGFRGPPAGSGGIVYTHGWRGRIYNNVVVGNAGYGIEPTYNTMEFKVYHNTIVGNGATAVQIWDTSWNVEVKGNIFWANGGGDSINVVGSPPGLNASNNLAGQDPQFVSTSPGSQFYQLQASSPAIAQGMSPPCLVASDYTGNVTRPQGPGCDLGATERDAGGMGPPATIAVSPATMAAGGTVSVSWTNLPAPNPSAWFGFYPLGAGHGDYQAWRYLTCTEFTGSPSPSQTCSFVVPAGTAGGAYQMRLFAATGTPSPIATSNTLTVSAIPTGEVKAFPTAEGFGANAQGGRGGRVYTVNTLADGGEGSLRQCMQETGTRTCVFSVAGTIVLNSPITVDTDQSNLTVAGQTAPHGGIQIRSAPGVVARINITGDAHDVIIRHLKVRPGVEGLGNFDGNAFAMKVGSGATTGVRNVILDHIETSWTGYLGIDFFGGVRDITVQWSVLCCGIIDPAPQPEWLGYGTIITAYVNTFYEPTITYHHNLFHNLFERLPNLSGMQADGAGKANIDFRNNFVHSWHSCSPGNIGGRRRPAGCENCQPGCTDCPDGPFDVHANLVGNKYVFATTGQHTTCAFLSLGGSGGATDTRVYVSDNSTPYCPGSPDCTGNPWDLRFVDQVMVKYDPDNPNLYAPISTEGRFRSPTPFAMPPVTTHSSAALENLLLSGGPGLIGVGPRKPMVDNHTQQIFSDVAARIGPAQGNVTLPYPDLTTGGTPYPTDNDGDGMSDAWETTQLLDPTNASDGAQLATKGTYANNGYTNLENYLNFLAGDPVPGGSVTPGGSNIFYLSKGGHGDAPADPPAGECAQGESPATPFFTFARACQCLTVAGGHLWVRGGLYNERIDTLTCPLAAGATAAAPTTIEGYANEAALFTLPLGQTVLVHLRGANDSFLKFKKLTFDAVNIPSSNVVHIAAPGHDILFDQVILKNGGASCVYLADVSNITFRAAGTPPVGAALTCGLNGIKTGGTVTNLRLEDQFNVHVAEGTALDLAGTSGTVNNAFIDRVRVHSSATSGGFAVVLGTGSGNVLQNSLIYDNTNGVRVTATAQNTRVDHNTITGNTGIGFQCDAGAVATTSRNNQINLNGTNVVNSCAITGSDLNNYLLDPLYTNAAADDYTLQPASLAINKATAIPGILSAFDGSARVQGSAPDYGAFERANAEIPPAPLDPLTFRRVPPYRQSWNQ